MTDTRLHAAALDGRAADITRLLADGRAIDARDQNGRTALLVATHADNVEAARTLIAAGVDVDHINKLGWTALLEAVILGTGGEPHQRIVDLLVQARARTDIADRDGVTPLAHARARGYGEIERILVAAGAVR